MREHLTTDDSPLPDGDGWRDIGHLRDSDYQIADGEPDIRGWTVRSREGRVIGKVRDLLINTRHRLAEYIEVELEGDESRRVILPIRTALLNEAEDEVHFLGVTSDALTMTPEEPSQSTKDLQRDLNRFFGSRRDGRDPSAYLIAPSMGTPPYHE